MNSIECRDTPTAVKIKSYSLRPSGKKGMTISLPTIWLDDLGLRSGDRVDIYRDSADRLVIVAVKKGEG